MSLAGAAFDAVPPGVAAAVLGAALLHAGWNALVKGRGAQTAGDPLLASALVACGAAVAGALLLPFVDAPEPASWPFIAGSSVLQVLYYRMLGQAYRHGDMSHAYPLMRGTAPLLVAVVNGPLTGERLAPGQWLAVALICSGVLAMLAGVRAAPDRQGTRRATVHALLTACLIAGYTLVDGLGVRRSGAPAGYTIRIFLLTGLGVGLGAGFAPARARALAALARARPWLGPVGGACTLGSYGIALWAMTLAPVAAIAALRETSILFATAIAGLVLRERVGPARLLGAGLIAGGAMAMRLG
jgi:drug/metabolite transporter (DMT)-like permease